MPRRKIILLLKIFAFLIFIGRAYQYLFFDAPFRTILWDESLLQPIIEGVFNTPWNSYVTNLEVDMWIQRSILINGFLYIIAAISVITINKNNRKYLRIPIQIGAWLLVILSLLTMKEQFFHIAQFFEHAIQFGIPFVLLYAIKGVLSKKISLYLKILIAFTFTSHGLYALGYYSVPGNYIDMTIICLGVTENTAVLILKIAGVLDLLISVLIFVPKLASYFLLYAFIWGLLTAFARIVAGFNPDFIIDSLHQHLYLVIYRIPHGLTPLLVFILHRQFLTNLKNQQNLSP